MSEYEVNLKVNIDSTEVDEAIEKFKQLAEAIEVVNGLMKERNEYEQSMQSKRKKRRLR